jgi:hypothetical protein
MTLQLRPPTEEDFKNLGECLARDQYHSAQTVEQWKNSKAELITFYDEKGPIFHIALERVLRVHFQHDQTRDLETRKKAMSEAIEWLKGHSREAGFVEIIFESTIKPLIKFFSQFGFKPSPAENKVTL